MVSLENKGENMEATATPATTTQDYSQHTISQLAGVIRKDWGAKVNFAAKPYLDAMFSLENINDAYFQDSGKSVVLYFLCNAGSWRGETAKAVKKELNKRAK